jgi:thiosulfate dehydrogenase (quinone) large subunit
MLDQRTVSEATYGWSRDEAATTPAYRECAYALLRLTLGIVFLFSGVGKFLGGIGNFEGRLEQQFAGKLPMFLVSPFAYALPFAEVAIGALLVIGLFNGVALVLSGLLLAALTFGTVMAGDHPTAAHNVAYAFVNFVLLWFAGYNKFSLDRLIRGRPIDR